MSLSLRDLIYMFNNNTKLEVSPGEKIQLLSDLFADSVIWKQS